MSRIYGHHELAGLDKNFNKNLWTALIPAAGKGSRLGFSKAKILYPIANKTILEWLLQSLTQLCQQVVLVLSEENHEEVMNEVEKIKLPPDTVINFAIQASPRGMGDAVSCGLKRVKNENILLIWGDQVAVLPETLKTCICMHEQNREAELTLPTYKRKDPYIHFQRNTQGKITKVLQKREGDLLPDIGENDCGLFLLRTAFLKEKLSNFNNDPSLIGAKTHEINFLPLIPFFETNDKSVITLDIIKEEETLGVNTVAEGQALTEILLKRMNKNS